MPVTGLIEQAPRNAYYMSDALGGDILFRTLCNNSWIFGDGSNQTSTMRINKNMISTTAGTFTHTGVLGVSNLNPQYTLDVAGDINFTGILRQNGSAYVGSQWSNNSNMVFLMNSNVGIGTSNPSFNLHVPGTIATSNLRVNNLTGTGSTINIGTDSNISTINIGGTNSTVNLIGSLSYITATDLTVVDKRITLNKNGSSATAGDAGIEIEEGGAIRAYIKTSADRNSFLFRTPNGSNDFTMNLINNAANFNNNLLVLNSNSRVGIGTNNPGYTFDVTGVINASSNILINGQALQAGYWVSTGTAINWTQSNVTIGTSSNPTGMRLYLAGTGTTNSGGTGDMTNVTSNLLTLYDINHPRIVHRSGNASISTVYNYESNKSVYWGETADTGYYSFRGRGLSVGYTTIPGSNYTLDVNGIANISDRLLVTNNIGVGTTNNSEKITIAAGNVALVHGGNYGNNGSSDKWISVGDRTQTLAPQFQQSNYGITMTWDTDGCFFGLRDFGTSRKDTVISFGDDTTDNLRFMYSNSADYMTITGTGNVGIGRSNPSYRLDINGDINFTGTLRSNGSPFVSGGGGGWSNNSSNVFVSGSNVGIGTSTPQRALHVVGDVQFDSNIFIANNTNIAMRGLLISKRNAGQGSTSITSLVTSINGFTYNSNVIILPASTCNIQLLSSNVGVGRSNPSYALDVLGDINFTGTFRQNGTPYVGSQWSNSGATVFITGSNVGIGTTTPTVALDVGGIVNLSNSPLRIPGGSNCILLQNNDPGDMIVRAYSTAGDRYGIGQYASGIMRLFSSTTFSSATVRISGPTNDVRTSAGAFNDYVTVLTGGANAGRVGIGTTSPGFALDVSGDINFSGTLRQGGSAYVGSQWSNNGSQIFINGSNVAIGKTTAATALDVNGTVTATNFIENGVALSSKYLQSSGANTFSTSNVYAGSNDSSNLPGFSWTTDTGTGMYRPSLCNIGLATGGIERFRMTSNGNIGINRTVPGYLLDVNGSLNGVTIFENASPLTTRYAQSNILQSYSNFVNTQYAPSNQLANYQTITAFNTYSNFVNGQYAPSNAVANAATFRWNSSNAFISGCNVGINTNTPQRALHVVGDIQVDSNLLMGGSIGVQGLQINRRTGGSVNIISSLPGYTWDSNITLTAATNSNINLSGNVRAQNSTTAGIRMGNTNSNIDNDAVVQLAGVAGTRATLASYQAALTEQTHIAINNTAGRVGTITSENSNVNLYGISQGAYITLGSNSNVGIITKTPTYTLEVSGNRTQAFRATGCNSSGNFNPICLIENTASNNPGVLAILASNVSSTTGNNFVVSYIGQSLTNGNSTQFIYSHFGTNNTSNSLQIGFYGGNNPLCIANNSNVGIGTNVPQSRLTINPIVSDSNTFNNSNCPLTVTQSTGTGTAVLNDQLPVLHLCRQGTLGQCFGARATLALSRYENNGTNSRTRLDIQLAHSTYDTVNVMSVRSDGNVGIGITSPTSTLHVSGTSRFTGAVVADTRIDFGNNTTYTTPTIGVNGGGGDRVVLSAGTGSAHPYSLGINGGTLWYSVPTSAVHTWFIGGTATMSLSSTALTCTQDITAFGTISDRKFKEDIVSLNTQSYLEKTCALRPVSFRWKDDLFNETYRGQYDIGFIAQEVEEIVPEAVKDTEMNGDEFKTIKYERLIPLLVSSIKELKEENRKLEKRVSYLETLVSA